MTTTSRRIYGNHLTLLKISTAEETISSRLQQLCQGNWKSDGKYWYFNERQPAEIVCTLMTGEIVAMKFEAGPSQGIVVVRLGKKEKQQDLYRSKDAALSVRLQQPLESGQRISQIVSGLVIATWLGLIIFTASVWFVTRPAFHHEQQPEHPFQWLWYSLTLIFTWSLFLLAFWPGLMSTDSLGQWTQMIQGMFDDSHPVFHTWTNWLITRAWLSPAAVAFAQLIALALVIGFGLKLMRKKGASGWITWRTVVLIALLPVNELMVITLWKDIPYTIAFIGLLLCVLLMIQSGGR